VATFQYLAPAFPAPRASLHGAPRRPGPRDDRPAIKDFT